MAAALTPPLEVIERALEDVGGGGGVDALGALFARQVGLYHAPRHGDGGEALVPERNGAFDARVEIGGELARRLAGRALAAVHVDGQAEHEACGVLAPIESFEDLRVFRELRAPDGFSRARDGSACVGERHADGFRAQVEADQRARRGQLGGKLGHVADRHGGCYLRALAPGGETGVFG